MNSEYLEQFEAKVERIPFSACWHWTGVIAKNSYGKFQLNKKQELAHRVSYEHYKGPIPSGLCLDHLCRNRSCVNPDHLEAVKQSENLLRSPIAQWSVNAKKTECPKGHQYTKENTLTNKEGYRWCRTCKREWMKAYRLSHQRKS